ncbi:receptor-type tyrosine-protein phosphatase N2-like [Pomacea canaliculata]|uniref:receptor-type tyrosine-protein phosphatase N2-like n=1 Tax=Pomacea canaliculata TaxID=400727 RepID=UPI000D73E7C5|nr:receptor-type tyrosine-protein phosphatase N2-like [Pomacea canaliculata]
MKGISWVLFLVVLAQIGHRSLSISGAPLENPFPLGTIGCLTSDVCGPGEVCKDDLLFGSCQDIYDLRGDEGLPTGGGGGVPPEDARDRVAGGGHLAPDPRRLHVAGCLHTVHAANTLVAFQRGRHFSPRLCEDALGVSPSSSSSHSSSSSPAATWVQGTDSEIAAVLKELLRTAEVGERPSARNFLHPRSDLSDWRPRHHRSQSPTDNFMFPWGQEAEGQEESEFDDGLYPLNSNKRDEFVQVHKYFDQSKGQLKRAPFVPVSDSDNYIKAFPQETLRLPSDDGATDLDKSYSPYQAFSPSEEQALLEAVQQEEEQQEEDDVAPEGQGHLQDGGTDFFNIPEAEPVGAPGMESSMGIQTSLTEQGNLQEAMAAESSVEGSLSLSPDDEATLEGLLEGSVEPDQLPLAQQRRLSRFIEVMISLLEMRGTDHLKDVDVVADDSTASSRLPPSEDNPLATQQAASATLIASQHHDVDDNENHQDTDGEEGGGADDPKEDNLEPPSKLTPDEKDDSDDADVVLEKKAPKLDDDDESSKPREKDDNKAVVDIRYTYIKFNNKVDEKSAPGLVANLTDILKVPPGVVQVDQVDGNQLILKVYPDSKWNSSTLASQAEDHSEELYSATGLKVVDAGVGKGVTVEVKKQDGTYVVVTFVLVGCIAGVVLAVTIIYLLRRHRRSRQKLAQLAATSDGNEASKDYQDLCRQRMQSKASEKPEPLHAASRIGSVSESQVRSPSSRSSTSSWSEEPAATNMDISTGHVVLAYMEDHLKNQDRLEQEWEALTAYQADPCGTTVAADAANARKNRYSDVLPYDHSRVILSASTNVSNSDYINASFITDHDPRNPAYVTTQGPLPHTVADFWQMVWEQGSVVIVMLTKLTENGTSMCHRYWPEEGSDLYHIYEVHLVSEHIWCDDYLVRSFYLKNLQTNETRTVTQFHFLTWPHLSVPPSMKALLDFRRKVNKSFRGGSCPIVVHCNDGCGRSGTYCLIDMVLNRMAKGAKEIDMAATLEHIRDQRMNMVQTKEQFQFALSAVADEVHAILKAMPQ